MFSFVLIVLNVGYFKNRNTDKIQNGLLIVFSFMFFCLFGFRSFNVGNDTQTYLGMFENSKDLLFIDFGFGFLNRALVDRVSERAFIIIIAFIYITPLYFGIKRISSKNRLMLFFCIVSFFFFKSMGMNTIRQGIAFSLFFLSITYSSRKRIKYVLMFVALSMHLSIILPILIFEISKFIKNLKIPVFIFILSTLLSIMKFNIYGILQKIPIISIADKIDSYSNIDSSDYKIGFRIDFFIFNFLFLVLGYFILKQIKDKRVYLRYLSSYLILSSCFFLMFNSGYSDRYGFLSWIFIPLLIVPVIKGEKINRLISLPTILTLCFFIAIIFYIIK
jgi:hypothetical protein